jgi:hypothetical protein
LEAAAQVAGATMTYKGTIADLLRFDGLSGQITVDAPRPGDLGRLVGADFQAYLPLQLSGLLTEANSFWRISPATGRLAGSALSGSLSLAEGALGEPDNIAANLDFPDLDLAPLVSAARANAAAASAGGGSVPHDADPGVTVALRLTAGQARLDGARFTAVDLDANATPDRLSVAALSFGAVGGTLRLSGTVETIAARPAAQIHVQISGAASGIDASEIAAAAGLAAGRLGGKLNMLMAFETTGEIAGRTLRDVLRAGRGTLVLSLLDGSIAREVIELASVDLRVLLRHGQGTTRLACLLGVLNVRNGVGILAPFRLRTPEGVITGGGQIDLLRETLDVGIHSESASTGFFALDVPIQISGSLHKPSIQPTRPGDPRAMEAQGAAAIAQLPEPQKALAARQPCAAGLQNFRK